MTAMITDCAAATTPSGSTPLQCAFMLIPSQVPSARHPTSKKKSRQKHRAHVMLHAQDVNSNQYDILTNDDDNNSGGDVVVYNPSSAAAASDSSVTSHSPSVTTSGRGPNKTRRGKVVLSRTGNLPDVHWRAIPLSHLRTHPNFKPLPPPSLIHHLPTKEHARYFRQDSWQWDYLHQGRCTTSQAAAALGFLEPKAAQFLGIPKSLQRGGVGAWERLREDTNNIYELKEMERVLCEDRAQFDKDVDMVHNWKPGMKETGRTWLRGSKLRNEFPFVAKYIPTITEEELMTKKLLVQSRITSSSPLTTRMQWGNAQEATSILTALNYFCSMDKNTLIHEVGMCGAGFDDADDSDMNGLKIGASPDAIICHGNGTVEVLEVKNHCPFVWNRISPSHSISHNRRSGHHQKNKKKKRQPRKLNNATHESAEQHTNRAKLFCLRDFDLECKVPPVYIPQLMMEMLCVGGAVELDGQLDKPSQCNPICTSAIMVRQTATRGAILLRLRRDDHWISEMKYFLGTFKKRYVDTGTIPPDDFFWDAEDSDRYQQFLQRTKDLSESVEQVAYIDNGRIQRMVMSKCAAYETPPLFLDCVEA
ncbi:hypothetical protein HJC23_013025 [Cyclotella cryptica]|uniref:YqaJ viral recombinase domain-containing protein n=1 Tax=Cyclotella cryptica TaxID=29204 RepID=A0ABD3QG78_9STRA|eukprot:CCRYP_005655-RA/>CCRYP_005655-RA protein AED:0.18 eAED:0.18 QI:0/0/0/1/1/1/2/0/589